MASSGGSARPQLSAARTACAASAARVSESAPAEVQHAVRATVVSLLGNLPPHLYDTNMMSTGQNVASLMYSMQMTGACVRVDPEAA